MFLHVRCIEASDLPIADVGGGSDAYCVISMNQETFKTRTIDNSLSPKWRQDYHFRIRDYNDDTISFTIYDHDKVGKDDKLCMLNLKTQILEPGKVIDNWYTMQSDIGMPKIHILLHVALKSDTPFVNAPFFPNALNIRVVEAQNIFLNEDEKKLEAYCQIKLDQNIQNTEKIYETRSPFWQEEFYFVVGQFEESIIEFNIKSKKLSCSVKKHLSELEMNRIHSEWLEITGESKIHVIFQVAPFRSPPFEGEICEPIRPVSFFSLHARIIDGKSLNGSKCFISMHMSADNKKKQKTKINDISRCTRWNQVFTFPIKSIGTEGLVIDLMETNDLNKPERVNGAIISLCNLNFNVINDNYYKLEYGELRMQLQVCLPNSTPFVPAILPVKQLCVRVAEAQDLAKVDAVGLSDPFVSIKLANDLVKRKTEIMKDTLHPVWNENFNFISVFPDEEVLEIKLKDSDGIKSTLMATANIQLSTILSDRPFGQWVKLDPKGKARKGGYLLLYYDWTSVGSPGFSDFYFPMIDLPLSIKRSQSEEIEQRMESENRKHKKKDRSPQSAAGDDEVLLYVDVIEAKDVPAMDSNGLSDPYVKLSMKERHGKKKTSVQYETLTPYWNCHLTFKVESIMTDVLHIVLYDYDKLSKDDKISALDLEISKLTFGAVYDNWYSMKPFKHVNAGGQLHLRVQLSGYGHEPFVPFTFPLVYAHVRVVEANINADSSYIELGLSTDLKLTRTSTKEKKLTWNEDFHFPIVSQTIDKLKFIANKSVKKKFEKLGLAELNLSELTYNKVEEQWIDLNNEKKENVGKIHVYIHVANENEPILPRLPAIEGFLCENLTLNFRLIKCVDLPALDRGGTSDPYCTLRFAGKEEKTSVISKTTNPEWNQEFHFPIKCFSRDQLEIRVYDHNIGKDKKIGSFVLVPHQLECGKVLYLLTNLRPSKGVKEAGSIEFIYHIASPGSLAFRNCFFDPLVLHVYLIEFDLMENKRIDSFVRMKLSNESVYSETTKFKYSSTPQFYTRFDFPLTNYSEDLFEIKVFKKVLKIEEEISNLIIPVTSFKINQVTQWNWRNMSPSGKNKHGGRVRMGIHVAPRSVDSFIGDIEPMKPPEPTNDLTMCVYVHSIRDLPKMDLIKGSADPYCLLSYVGRDEHKVKSRTIYNNLNPFIDSDLRIPIISLATDVLRISVMDADDSGKDDPISFIDIPLSDVVPGVTCERTCNLNPFKGIKAEEAGKITLRYQLAAPGMIPYVNNPFPLDRVNIRIIEVEGAKITSNKVTGCVSVKLSKDIRSRKTNSKENEINGIYDEELGLLIADYTNETLQFALYDATKNKELSTSSISLNTFTKGKTEEKWLEMNGPSGGRLHVLVQIATTNEIPFTDAEFNRIGKSSMTFYAKIIEARNLPKMDANGMCDPYIVYGITGRGKSKKTEVQHNTLEPKWNQLFEYNVESLETDIFRIELFDEDKRTRDDKIGEFSIRLKNLGFGRVADSWYKLTNEDGYNAEIHLLIHLAGPGQPKFDDGQFIPYTLHVRVREAMEIAKVDRLGKSDPYVSLMLEKDLAPVATNVIDNTLSPRWERDFHFLLTNPITDNLVLTLKDKGSVKDTKMATMTLNVNRIQLNTIIDDWFDLQPEKGVKQGGKLRLMLNVTEYTNLPFTGVKVPRALPLAGEVLELHVQMIEARNIPAMDLGGTSDVYATLGFLGHPNSFKKTRIIEKTTNPEWDQTFRLPICSLNTDVFVVTIFDHDDRSKDDKISEYSIQIKNLGPGIVVDKWFTLSPFASSKGGEIHMALHLTEPGQQPFVTQQFCFNVMNLHFVQIEGTENSKSNDLFLSAKMENDIEENVTTSGENNVYNEQMCMLVTNETMDKLIINLNSNVEDGKYVKSLNLGKAIIDLSKCAIGKCYRNWFDFKGTSNCSKPGKVEVIYEIVPYGTQRFFNQQLPQQVYHIEEHRCFHLQIVEAENLPKVDVNGLCDAFCVVTLFSQKKQVWKTRMIEKNLNPKWNQVFHIPVTSLEGDSITVEVFDYDKFGANDLLGKVSFRFKEQKFGVPEIKWYQLKTGQINIRTHISNYGEPAFLFKPFVPQYIYVSVDEAADIPKIDFVGKTDCYAKISTKGSVIMDKTRPIDNSLTPQWFQQFMIVLNDYMTDSLYVELYDDGVKDTKFSTLEIHINKYEKDLIHSNWFNLEPVKDKNSGGRIHLRFQITDYLPQAPFFVCPEKQVPPLPPCPACQLHLVIERAQKLPAMDVVASDPYCRIEFDGHPGSLVKTRVIDNTLNPYWNDHITLDVPSINSDVLRVSIYDKDAVRDDLIGYCTFSINKLNLGEVIQYKDYELERNGRKGLGTTRMKMHLCSTGMVPFISDEITDKQQINLYIGKIDGIEYKECYLGLKMEKELNETFSYVRSDGTFNEKFKFLITNPGEKLIINLYEQVDDGKVKRGKLIETIPVDTSQFALCHKIETVINKIHMFVYVTSSTDPIFDYIKFSPSPPVIGECRMFNLEIIEARNLPKMDTTGKCDAYCTVKLQNRHKLLKEDPKIYRTRIVEKTLNPTWKQAFNIEIKSIRTDIVKIDAFDYDKRTKDDRIGSIPLNVSKVPFGIVVDEWRTLSTGQVHLRYHFSDIGQPSFVDSPFMPLRLDVELVELDNLPKVNGVRPNCKTLISIKGDTIPLETGVKINTRTPQYFSKFSLLLNSYELDALQVSVHNVQITDNEFCHVDIPIRNFKVGVMTNSWYNLEEGGRVRLVAGVTQKTTPEFSLPIEPPPPMQQCSVTQVYVHLLELTNFVAIRDFHCILKYADQTKRSRRIDQSNSPVWDEIFDFDVKSFLTDSLTINLYDHKEQYQSFSISIDKMNFGNVIDHWFEGCNGVRLHCKLHLCCPGQIPFVSCPFVPLKLESQVLDISNPIPNSFFTFKMQNDQKCSQTNVTSSGQFRENNSFLIVNRGDVFNIELHEIVERRAKLVGSCDVSLGEFELNQVYRKTLIINSITFTMNFAVSMSNREAKLLPPLQPVDPFVSPKMCLHVRIVDATNLIAGDVNNSSDPFCSLKLRKRKEKLSTRIIAKNVNPTWKETFHIEIPSLHTDVLKIKVFDYDKITMNENLGEVLIPVNQITCGQIISNSFGLKGKGKLNVVYQLTDANQPAFVPTTFVPLVLHVRVIEGMDLKNINSLTRMDPICQLLLKNDITSSQTSVKKDTISPQWFEYFNFLVTSHSEDVLRVNIIDYSSLKLINSTVDIPLASLDVGKSLPSWFDLKTAKGEDAGRIHLLLQLLPPGNHPFDDYSELDEKLVSDKMMLHLKIIEARNLSAKDANGGSDPFCVITMARRSYKEKTRIIQNSINPKWNDTFHLPVASLGTDRFKITVYDWDKASKDDPIGFIEVLPLNISPGLIFDQWISLNRIKEDCTGELHVKYHLTAPGQISFDEVAYSQQQLNLRLLEFDHNNDKNIYFKLSLSNDIYEQISSVKRNENAWNEDFSFLITNYEEDSLVIRECVHNSDKDDELIDTQSISLKDLIEGEKSVEFKDGCLHLLSQVAIRGVELAKIQYLVPKANYQVYLNVVEANISKPKKMFVEVKYEDASKYSRVSLKTNKPAFNTLFEFPVCSLNTDQITFVLKEFNEKDEDKIIGFSSISVSQFNPGELIDTFIKLIDTKSETIGDLHILYQLANVNQQPFFSQPFLLNKVHIYIDEVLFPENNKKKRDLYIALKISNDSRRYSLDIIKNTNTPQWNQLVSLSYIDKNSEILEIYLMEKRIKDDNEIGKIEIPISNIPDIPESESWEDIDGNGLLLGLLVSNSVQCTINTSFALYQPIPIRKQ